jgi:type I restriction enzyme R subunit
MVQSQNFEFLREKFPLLADLGAVAEAVIYTDPGSSTTRLRSFAEEVVKSIYEFESLPRTAKANFADLLFASDFQNSITPSLMYKLDYLRQQGNLTAHGALGNQKTAFACLGTAFGIGQYLMVNYHKVPNNALLLFRILKRYLPLKKS